MDQDDHIDLAEFGVMYLKLKGAGKKKKKKGSKKEVKEEYLLHLNYMKNHNIVTLMKKNMMIFILKKLRLIQSKLIFC